MTDPRRRVLLGGGLLGAAMLFGWTVWPEPMPAPPAVAAAATEGPPALPIPLATAASAPSVEGLVLFGVSGGGPGGSAALIGSGPDQQRLVAVGREYRPGLIVAEVGAGHAVLTGAGGAFRLELSRFAGAPARPSSPPAPAPAEPALQGMDGLKARLGLAPRKVGGRIAGFTLKPGADLPALRRAGLRPGDTILAVNGQAFDSEEKVIELPREIAGSYTAEFEYERGGRRLKASLPVNPRPGA